MFVFRESPDMSQLSPADMEQIFRRWMAWVDELRAKGLYLGGEPLEPQPASVLRGATSVTVTDGPYAEAKEIVGGFILIRAASLAEAVAIARGCPGLPDGGSVEVRQVMPMP